jgi:hypothetical protein
LSGRPSRVVHHSGHWNLANRGSAVDPLAGIIPLRGELLLSSWFRVATRIVWHSSRPAFNRHAATQRRIVSAIGFELDFDLALDHLGLQWLGLGWRWRPEAPVASRCEGALLSASRAQPSHCVGEHPRERRMSRNSVTGSGTPFSSWLPSSSATNRPTRTMMARGSASVWLAPRCRARLDSDD